MDENPSDLDPQALAGAVARWQECADLVAGDVRRTTDLSGAWVVEVREDEDALRADVRAGVHLIRDGQAYRSQLKITFGKRRERPRVPLLLPEIWLVAPGVTEMLLSTVVVEVEVGAAEIAERVQDEVIDQIWGEWPVCPGHGHPAVVAGPDWICPTDRWPIAAIGALGM